MVQLMLRRGLTREAGAETARIAPLGGPGPVGQRLAGRHRQRAALRASCRGDRRADRPHRGRTFRLCPLALYRARRGIRHHGPGRQAGSPPGPPHHAAPRRRIRAGSAHGERADARRHDLREPVAGSSRGGSEGRLAQPAPGAARVPPGHGHPQRPRHRSRPDHQDPVGRQQAEGLARQVALRRRGALPRHDLHRADRGRGRRGQAGDLRPYPPLSPRRASAC